MTFWPLQGIPEISTLPWFTLFAPLVCLLLIRATRDLVDDIVSEARVAWARVWEVGTVPRPHIGSRVSPGGLGQSVLGLQARPGALVDRYPLPLPLSWGSALGWSGDRGQGCLSDPHLLVQGRHRSDNIINNRPCQILKGKR